MGSRLVAAGVCLAFGSLGTVSWAGEAAAGETGSEVEAVAPSVASVAPVLKPWIHPSMSPGLREPLEAGFALALQRLRTMPACRELFFRLGADPFETLASGLYFPVGSYRREVEWCGRNAVANSRAASNLAFTTVGGCATFICRQFERVDSSEAAVLIIHEALHHAGLTEWPNDRLAMRSCEITEMVEEACGF